MEAQQAHVNMVKQQIRPVNVTDPVLLELLLTLPREHFVPKGYEHLAYADINIPIGYGEVMLAPQIIGLALQALQIKKTDKILQIGTGSGYLTALLSHLGHHVYTVDSHPECNHAAQHKCSALGIHNVNFIDGDGFHGWPEYSPFDVIVITGSVGSLPKSLREQVTTTGRIFAVIGRSPRMEATLLTQSQPQEWQATKLFETHIPPLANAPQGEQFVF